MSSQRRFKAIDDYPSKFDWPGIKGLRSFFYSFSKPAFEHATVIQFSVQQRIRTGI